ncbi:hypothetical protein ACVWWK_002707 [Bradyrhizobium sp. LB9.1b]
MMAEIAGRAQGSAIMAAFAWDGLMSRTRRNVQRCDAEPGPRFAPSSLTHGPRLSSAALRAALRPGHESGVRYISARPRSNGSSPLARFFFFERCQTTPGKPVSGTSGSPV